MLSKHLAVLQLAPQTSVRGPMPLRPCRPRRSRAASHDVRIASFSGKLAEVVQFALLPALPVFPTAERSAMLPALLLTVCCWSVCWQAGVHGQGLTLTQGQPVQVLLY